jgi:uroporphyrinogen-III synthase
MELEGKSIVVTRSPDQAPPFLREIERRGGKALLFPTLLAQASDNKEEKKNILKRLDQFHWIVFSSENAVRYFWAETKKNSLSLAQNKIAVVGPKTATTLQRLGIQIDLIPTKYSAAGLLDSLKKENMKGKDILLPVSNLTRPELAVGLKKLGARVHTAVFYQIVPNPGFKKERLEHLIKHQYIQAITFFSPSSFTFLVRLMGDSTYDLLKNHNIALAAIGPTTAKVIRSAGLPIHIQPVKSTVDDMVQAIIQYFRKRESHEE